MLRMMTPNNRYLFWKKEKGPCRRLRPLPLPVSIRQHTSAYVSIRQEPSHRLRPLPLPMRSAYVQSGVRHTFSIRSVMRSAYVSKRQHTSAYVSICRYTSASVSIRQHMSAYVGICQQASAYVSKKGGVACAAFAYGYNQIILHKVC
jgi:hypothetical protein